MTVFSKIANELFSEYKNWVCKSPGAAGNIESIFRFVAIIAAGRISDSKVVTEWAYCSGRLLRFFHQLLMHSSRQSISGLSDKLKIFIGLVENCELALEKSVEHVWSERAKWTFLTFLQLAKCMAKLTLLLHFNDRMNYSDLQPIKAGAPIKSCKDGLSSSNIELSDGFVLASSGRMVRKVQAAPPLHDRLWKPPVINILKQVDLKCELETHQLFGELLYVVKPLLTLALILKYGYGTWKPWFTSLAMDFLSLALLHYQVNGSTLNTNYTPEERKQLRRRHLQILLYLLKYPCFWLGPVQLLHASIYRVPFIGRNLKQHLNFYLRSYSFLWSN